MVSLKCGCGSHCKRLGRLDHINFWRCVDCGWIYSTWPKDQGPKEEQWVGIWHGEEARLKPGQTVWVTQLFQPEIRPRVDFELYSTEQAAEQAAASWHSAKFEIRGIMTGPKTIVKELTCRELVERSGDDPKQYQGYELENNTVRVRTSGCLKRAKLAPVFSFCPKPMTGRVWRRSHVVIFRRQPRL